jgi:hypothetical protein
MPFRLRLRGVASRPRNKVIRELNSLSIMQLHAVKSINPIVRICANLRGAAKPSSDSSAINYQPLLAEVSTSSWVRRVWEAGTTRRYARPPNDGLAIQLVELEPV